MWGTWIEDTYHIEGFCQGDVKRYALRIWFHMVQYLYCSVVKFRRENLLRHIPESTLQHGLETALLWGARGPPDLAWRFNKSSCIPCSRTNLSAKMHGDFWWFPKQSELGLVREFPWVGKNNAKWQNSRELQRKPIRFAGSIGGHLSKA